MISKLLRNSSQDELQHVVARMRGAVDEIGRELG